MTRTPTARSRRARGRDDRGAVMVEFALTLPLLVMLMLGMFTGGLAYNQKLAISNGVREGSRFGATLPVASSSCASGSQTLACWLTQVADITQSASEGDLGSAVASRSVCVAYVYPSGNEANDETTFLRRTASGDVTQTLPGERAPCFSDGRPDTERRVQVTGSRVGTIELMFATLTPTLSSESVTKFEAP